ncbi:MAG TPA: AGE family epimerase/isomerase [Lachnospiraceae bacterium]|nr:AGE family epimerase/isomerase [Lachnospiraceae bacterium]
MKEEIKSHLVNDIIPFWKALRDKENGGYYGFMDFNLKIDKKAVKGCILNSRITWFFSNAYTLLQEESLLEEATHGFEFMKNFCMDQENGGIFWSMHYDGTPNETIKHTYNQAFAIYALSSYYEASGNKEALNMAYELYHIIEEKCTDPLGYKEAFDLRFQEINNDKLSENGVIAEKTMNTLLHVFEAYTELYRVDKNPKIKERLEWILDVFADKVYNKELHRQEVFFDKNYNSILDLHSYGHDIETAWLIDRGVEVIGEQHYQEKMTPITKDLTNEIFKVAFNGQSLGNECEKGEVNSSRIWWVQAETVLGFLNGYRKSPEKIEYLQAAKNQWEFIKDKIIDKRPGSEWFWSVDEKGEPNKNQPIVEPWKCPYHNGRMCFEVIKDMGTMNEEPLRK